MPIIYSATKKQLERANKKIAELKVRRPDVRDSGRSSDVAERDDGQVQRGRDVDVRHDRLGGVRRG